MNSPAGMQHKIYARHNEENVERDTALTMSLSTLLSVVLPSLPGQSASVVGLLCELRRDAISGLVRRIESRCLFSVGEIVPLYGVPISLM